MRVTQVAVTLSRFAFGLMIFALPAFAADLEKPEALNGSAYAVIAPLYDGSNGSALSFIRLFNGASSTSTFSVTVVNADNGVTLGATTIPVPANASQQFPLTGGNTAIFTKAAVSAASGTKYALYIANSDQQTGYAHVTFSNATQLFENNSVCGTPLSQQTKTALDQVLTNVHTSALASGNYPSVVSIHNYQAFSVTDKITVYDATTGSNLGQFNKTIAANSSLTLPESEIETLINLHPTSAQVHINLIVTDADGNTPSGVLSQSIHNAVLGGDINMSSVCAVNALGASAATAATPVGYCGTLSFPYPYNAATVYFTAAVASNGRVRGTAYGQGSNYVIFSEFVGTLTGTTFTATGDNGAIGSGTIKNGAISGTFNDPEISGTGTISGSTTACN